MCKERILNLLAKLDQHHLAEGMETLSQESLDRFYKELVEFAPVIDEMKKKLFSQERKKRDLEALTHYANQKEIIPSNTTLDLLGRGKVGCIILSGGQGSRLGSSLPKALVPIIPSTGKTLIDIVLERVFSARERYGSSLRCAVMTSPENHEAITSFLEEKISLKEESVSLFSQSVLPLLKPEGDLLLAKPGGLAVGPNGNGDVFSSFAQSSLLKTWQEEGVEHVIVIFIDNPLADPFDLQLLEWHVQKGAEVTLKCIERADPEESVGIVALDKGKVRTIEYFELSENEKNKRNSDGELLFSLANGGMYAFSIDFLEKASAISLPWHFAKKNVSIAGQRREIWKCETFLFDALDQSSATEVVVFDRKEVFAPVKNRESLEHVQHLLD